MHQAAARAAHEAARKLDLDDDVARQLAPIGVAITLSGMKRNFAGIIGATALGFALDRSEEDLLTRHGRLSAADIRARGEALMDRILRRRHSARAVTAIADLAEIDTRSAKIFLAMSGAAVLSALAKTKRELRLNALQIHGVMKSEAARIDNADPSLINQVIDWVFRPNPLLVIARRLFPYPPAPASI